MSVSKMEKLTVVLPHAEAEPLLRQLMRRRSVSLSLEKADGLPPTERLTEHTSEAAAEAARVDAVLPVLAKHSRRKKPLFGSVTHFDSAEFKRSGDEERAWKTVKEVERILADTARAEAELAKEDALMQSLLPYLNFKFSLDDAGTRTAKILLGSLPGTSKKERLEELAAEHGFVPEILSEDSRGTYISVVTHTAPPKKTPLPPSGASGFYPPPFHGETDEPPRCSMPPRRVPQG